MSNKPHIQSLVINWHVTEACNYRCQYCYATWREDSHSKPLIHDPKNSSALLHQLFEFFRPDNHNNPLNNKMTWSSVRLNLAGGEPLLFRNRLPAIADEARELGFEVSLITNGSRMSQGVIEKLAPELTWFGISIDSANVVTNCAIGRLDRKGQQVNIDKLCNAIELARQKNPEILIKLNTVINKHNHLEDFSPLIQRIAPDKWKALQVLPLVDQHLSINHEQFAAFVDRHDMFTDVLYSENNQDMYDSYIMVSPQGHFFQNSLSTAEHPYTYSRPILQAGTKAAFSDIAFDHERFSARYIHSYAGARA